MDGAYALGIICADYPDRLLCARKDAPLLLGFGEGENMIASDVTAIIRHTRDIAYLDDGELAILSAKGIRVYDSQMRPIEKEHRHVDWDVAAAEKGGYEHFMLKEIHEQPRAIREATAARIQGGQVVLRDLNMTDQQIRDINKIFIVACGSSYHVGMVGKYNLERMLRRSVEVCLASEFRYSDPIVGKGDLVIVISQSGETLDTMAALREAKRRGAHILSIVNVVGSSIARESHTVLYTWAGPEIAVATTKAYSTQMAVLNLLGLYFSQVMGTLDHAVYSAMVRGIEKLPEQMERILEQAEHIHFNDVELRVLAKTGTGVAHCPISNMKLSSGIARIPEMLELGVPVGLAVDGSASNDGSSLMEELRVAFLLHRLNASRRAPTGYDVLKMATRGSARLLGRDDIGQLAVGKCADLFMIDSRRLELVGSCFDPKSVLGTVGVRGPVDYTVVHGRVTVAQGHLMTVDEERLAQDAETCCRQYLAR